MLELSYKSTNSTTRHYAPSSMTQTSTSTKTDTSLLSLTIAPACVLRGQNALARSRDAIATGTIALCVADAEYVEVTASVVEEVGE